MAELLGQRYAAVANLGVRPTFQQGEPRAEPIEPLLEVHVPGIEFDFYGEPMEVEFVRKIRQGRKVLLQQRQKVIPQFERERFTLMPCCHRGRTMAICRGLCQVRRSAIPEVVSPWRRN